MKKEKGITLVSLVVTIIILIILAGVSINLTLGKNGIITIAKQAKENTELAKIEEETALNELYMQIEAEGGTTGDISYDAIAKLTEFKTAIANYIEEAGGVKPETTSDTTTFGESIKGIVKEVTKNATATADNITEGKTAYVNGELITGTGTSNVGIEELCFQSSNTNEKAISFKVAGKTVLTFELSNIYSQNTSGYYPTFDYLTIYDGKLSQEQNYHNITSGLTKITTLTVREKTLIDASEYISLCISGHMTLVPTTTAAAESTCYVNNITLK